MKKIISAISIILATLIAFSAFPAHASQRSDKKSRVIFYNIAGEQGEAWSGDCIFVQSDGRWGMIDTGHRYENSIVDSDGRRFELPRKSGLSSQNQYKNGRDAVLYMMESFGLTHLDFIIATHSHSDHIGGVPEIAQLQYTDTSGNSHYIVDENTVYFYKQYYHVNNQNDDLERYTPYSWHNQAFYYQALSSMQERGAVTVELSKGGIAGIPCRKEAAFADDLKAINAMPYLSGAYQSSGSSKDYYDDILGFSFGELQINLFNLLAQNSKESENANSICAVITDGNRKIVSMADSDFANNSEQQIAQAIYNRFGTADLFKANHHGSYRWSNTRETLDYMQPKACVVTRRTNGYYKQDASGAFSYAMAYMKENYGTDFYEVGYSDFGVSAEFTSQGLKYYCLTGTGNNARFGDTGRCINRLAPYEGWNFVETDFYGSGIYYYIIDGKIARGWQKIDYEWYYLDESGVMQTGWKYINGNWYYFDAAGIMQSGWVDIDGSRYYFDDTGEMLTGWQYTGKAWYYISESGVMQTDWQKLDGKWYYFNDGKMQTGWLELNGEWYYFNDSGAMRTGWQLIAGKWYYFNSDGVMQNGWKIIGKAWYYFNNGAMQTGWKQINGNWFYFSKEGIMRTGWLQLGGKWYYFSAAGIMQTEWKKIGSSWYYFAPAGYMLTGEQEINGTVYYFSAAGVWIG